MCLILHRQHSIDFSTPPTPLPLNQNLHHYTVLTTVSHPIEHRQDLATTYCLNQRSGCVTNPPAAPAVRPPPSPSPNLNSSSSQKAQPGSAAAHTSPKHSTPFQRATVVSASPRLRRRGSSIHLWVSQATDTKGSSRRDVF